MRFSNQFLPLFFISLIFVPVRFFLSLYLRQKKTPFFWIDGIRAGNIY